MPPFMQNAGPFRPGFPAGPQGLGMQGPPQSPAQMAQPPAPQGLQQQQSGPDIMNTLFPPLPSQGGIAAVEQQLQYLTMNQHAQAPAVTGAQLQALLQQAQYQAARDAAGPTGAPAAEVGGTTAGAVDDAERAAQKAAGEQLIRNVEQRIQEHEMLEQKRKAKAAKIAALVSPAFSSNATTLQC